MTTPAQARTTSVALAASARSVQIAVRSRLLQDVTKLWPALDPKRLDETFPGWLRAMMLLLRNYHGQSAAAAGVFYRKARADAILSPTPRALIRLAPPPAEEWMSRALGFAGPGMFELDTAQPNTALATTLGTSARIGLDGGRRTIIDTTAADPVAVGWYRVTKPAPCYFCALLASRGVIYTETTAAFQAHNGCGCTAAPAFTPDQPLPDVSKRAAQVYLDRGGGPAIAAFRKAWAQHQAN